MNLECERRESVFLKRHVSFAAVANEHQDGGRWSVISGFARSMSEGNNNLPTLPAKGLYANEKWTISNEENMDLNNAEIGHNLDTKNTSKVRKRRNSGNESKRASFFISLGPVLRQWSKLATAIGTTNSTSSSQYAYDNVEADSTSEDLFLKRFSTRQLALSSRYSVPSIYAKQISQNTKSDAEEGGEEKIGNLRKCISSNIVSPDGAFVFYWLSILTLAVLWNWWTLIVRQCFKELTTEIFGFWFIVDSCADFIFLIDLLIQLRTGYLEQGLLVMDSKKLAKRYFWSTQFAFDALSMTPLDYLPNVYYPILRFPRLLKTYRAIKFHYMLESRTVYPNVIRVANWCHILLLACHWFACFHFMIASLNGFNSRWTEWSIDPVGNASLTRKYLLSLYWSTLTLTTIGTTATPGAECEYLFTIISYLIGVFVFAAIVGQVGNVITNRNARRLEFERLSDGAKQYMRYHKVPKDMQRRVQQWFDYSWSRGRMTGNADTQALSVLPDKLKTELALRVNLNTLRKVTMFQECQPQFLHDLVLKMRAVIFTPGDIVCRKGEVAREMYIIADGVLEVLNEEGDVLRVMRAGDFFGEIGILNLDSGLNKRTADVRSVGYSELFCLSREDVLAATKDYPGAEAILREHGQRRLQNTFNRESRPVSQCSNISVESDTSSIQRKSNTVANDVVKSALELIQSTSIVPQAAIRRNMVSMRMHHRRVERRSHSERPNVDTVASPTVTAVHNAQRNRSCSVANVNYWRHANVPSHVTNLLGCPVVRRDSNPVDSVELGDKGNANGYQMMPTVSLPFTARMSSIEDEELETSNTEYTCNDEMVALKNNLNNFICPQVYANVIQEIQKTQQDINSKFKMLVKRFKLEEVDSCQENNGCHETASNDQNQIENDHKCDV